jgi:hypothetical protein
MQLSRCSMLMRGRYAGALALVLAFAQPAAAGETRGYVVSWWHIASSMEGRDDCPNGLNPGVTEVFARVLREQGVPPAEIEKRVNAAAENGQTSGGYAQTMMMRGKDKDGAPANVYINPETAPDPQLKRSQSRFAYGFNLDGTIAPGDFTDPETGERGVKNQFYRAVGCIDTFRATPGVSRPTVQQFMWDVTREHTPAWLIEITDIDDDQNDDEVFVNIYQATNPIAKDAIGEVRRDMTMFVDAGSRTHVHLRGSIKNGRLTTEPSEIDFVGDPYLVPEYQFKKARLRINFKKDASIQGILGGYHDWRALYWGGNGESGSTWEYFQGADLVGFWYALKKSADADPDPKTGENRAISASYWIEAVPAFVIHPKDGPAGQVARQ